MRNRLNHVHVRQCQSQLGKGNSGNRPARAQGQWGNMKPAPAGTNQAALLPKTALESDLLDGAAGFGDQLARALNAIPLQFLTQRAPNAVREPTFQGASGNTDGFGNLLNTQGAVTMIPNKTPCTLHHVVADRQFHFRAVFLHKASQQFQAARNPVQTLSGLPKLILTAVGHHAGDELLKILRKARRPPYGQRLDGNVALPLLPESSHPFAAECQPEFGPADFERWSIPVPQPGPKQNRLSRPPRKPAGARLKAPRAHPDEHQRGICQHPTT